MDHVSIRDRLKLRQLRHVLAVSELGRLNLAADRLHISEAAVSKSLAEVNAILGVPVFRRERTRWVPTEPGVRLIAFARRITAEFDAFDGVMQDLRSGVQGTVVIGLHVVSGQLFIAETLAKAKRDYPGIVIRVVEGVLPDLIDDLRNGTVDLVFGRIGQVALDRSFGSVGIVNEPVRVVASPNHPLSRKRKLTWADMMQSAWILPLAGTPARDALADYLSRQGFDLPANRIDTKSISLISQLLSSGSFVSIAPQSVVQHWAERLSMHILPLPPFHVGTPIGLIWSKANLLPAAEILKNYVLEHLEAERPRAPTRSNAR
ncbi:MULTISPECIES: LysR family transcriptional regulator [unclassified Beijerinckia]|uniref:LysR family transcriptional regulator n=1 Tax=unclassified Beijerinckia TaxID=2638183 RepID=UPI00089A5FFE|nr:MULTISPECIES: LysR family transcriptional regulator [unclassified Beijerinckia]MDH7796976.1 DNA-binding transcriptional LysR family regulator [Beijerinckia sp. GAS462]SEC67242.1 DNA-binding transcriptional regulator, LysR family [Beijerinckia sp. 28-YEA-48]